MTEIRVAAPCGNHLGEGAFWDDLTETLWWLDVPMPSRLYSLRPSTGEIQSVDMPEMITSMRALKDGSGLIVASHGGVNVFSFADRTLRRLLDPEPEKPFNRSNDGSVDAKGRFWFGTMQNNIAPDGAGMAIVSAAGSLFRLDPDMKLTKRETEIGIPNTVCWSPDDRVMYFCDTMTGVICAYDFDLETGAIANKRAFARFDRGVPDGSTVDAEGYLWNARWGGHCVVRFSPDGSVDRVLEMPVGLVTSVAFGGRDLKTLFITTARHGMSPEGLAGQPLSGHLFACEPGVGGLPAGRFG